jgi:hypothetical protein
MRIASLIIIAIAILGTLGYVINVDVYPKIVEYRLLFQVDFLRDNGFAAYIYRGEEVRRPGIEVDIPSDWVGNTEIFSDMKGFGGVLVINARNGEWVSKNVLDYFAKMPHLEEVELEGQAIDDVALRAFLGNKQIKGLGLSRTKLTTNSIKTLSTLENLEELDLAETDVEPASTGLLCANWKLNSLRLSGIKVGDEEIKKLTCLKKMRRLYLSYTDISPHIGDVLVKFGELEGIRLDNELMSDALLRKILEIKSISFIDVSYCTNDEALLAQIRKRAIQFNRFGSCRDTN